MLLNDEEISKVIEWEEQPFPVARMVAKAQLKKVVEWLRGGAPIHVDDNGQPDYRILTWADWQALLEEIK